ncbi:hypothetical protein FT663_00769 [Candidozyma haemuli var. vulneris]|uniref:Ribosomal RNA-processing protein 17 n=1 Tax=Candidozyma haemuli TaxID=45357 RepID=A0A2V1AZG0_9ASCO|nr:hypothetical protein CXQ85_005298 [[Candida] haemuloni]KAF3992859.1 hypothetical protein FT662_00861 [[Candida] haemuloni var. vulneris]KAF3995070.1 hypothetical protein FT663_00769 [[Candida] haemuloni var. vulneris]PVH22271.1 hypothetical protein CXQ85_005298 [[Candida] haemuloni]
MVTKTNRDILTGGKKYQQKQAKKYGVEEVVFDKQAREEFLTGFHKRKVERQKKAQAYHKEQERKARIEERKQLREDEKNKFEEQLKQLRESRELLEPVLDKEEVEATPNGKAEVNAKESDDEWTGFEEDNKEEVAEDAVEEGEEDEEPVKGILSRKQVFKADNKNYLGDAVVDKETEVTIESLDNPYTTAITNRSIEALAKANNVNLDKSDEVLEGSIKRAKDYAKLCGVEKPKPKQQKKKKFRYLTKAERKDNNMRQKISKLKSRRQAMQK